LETYYNTVGVERNATDKDIKSAFRVKVKIAHPDFKTGTDDDFKKLREAYNCLINPIKRQEYDEKLAYLERPIEEVSRREPTQTGGPQTNTQPQAETLRQTGDRPKETIYVRKYSVNYALLFKWFVCVFTAFVLIGIYVTSSIINKSNYYLSKDLNIDQSVILTSIVLGSLIGSAVVYMLHKMRLDSWVYVCIKFLGIKLTNMIIKILMIKPPKIFSLKHISYAAVTYILIGIALILVDKFRFDLQNWIFFLAVISILGGILVELRIRYGLYFVYLTAIPTILIGFILVIVDLVHANYADMLIKVIAIIVASSFLISIFNRRFWFH
jgi:hypothetical protein